MAKDRSTGGNTFISENASSMELVGAIARGLNDLRREAIESKRVFDLGEVTIETKRINDGRISVSVMADLQNRVKKSE